MSTFIAIVVGLLSGAGGTVAGISLQNVLHMRGRRHEAMQVAYERFLAAVSDVRMAYVFYGELADDAVLDKVEKPLAALQLANAAVAFAGSPEANVKASELVHCLEPGDRVANWDSAVKRSNGLITEFIRRGRYDLHWTKSVEPLADGAEPEPAQESRFNPAKTVAGTSEAPTEDHSSRD